MKTKEELNALKIEVEAMHKKLADLTEDEFAQVTGGIELGSTDAIVVPDHDIHRIDEHHNIL